MAMNGTARKLMTWVIMMFLTLTLTAVDGFAGPPGAPPCPEKAAPKPPELPPKPPPPPPTRPFIPEGPPQVPAPPAAPLPPPAERPKECPPEVWQAWEQRKNEARERYNKKIAQTRDEYTNSIRGVYKAYDPDIARYSDNPDMVKIFVRSRDKRVNELKGEMEKKLAGLNGEMEKEIAQLEQKQKECASPTKAPPGEPAPPTGPPLAEKPKKCPDEVVQYWRKLIEEAEANRASDLDNASHHRMMTRDTSAESEKQYEREYDFIQKLYDKLINEYESNIKNCRKP